VIVAARIHLTDQDDTRIVAGTLRGCPIENDINLS
jgi:hypothetical protein